jgi:hypothetical protein
VNVAELIEELEQMDPEAEVRLAIQPGWPFQHTIAGVYDVPAKDPSGEPNPDQYSEDNLEQYEDDWDAWEERQDAPDTDVVYIAEGGQLYSDPYLPGAAANAIGWGR